MRRDLLDAQASVDWAVSQFPSLEERIETWLASNIEVIVENQPIPATHDVIVALEKSPFPLAFNVEVGAYINAMRSSLDLLAVAIGRRYQVLFPEHIYFPIAASANDFATGNHKGNHLIKQLPADARLIFESLKPYDGGNNALWAIHNLDITRKHRRLIGVEIIPRDFSITGTASLPQEVAFVGTETGWLGANEKTALALIRKGAARYQVQFTAHIAFSEAGAFYRKPVVWALSHFARWVTQAIAMFDDP